MTVYQDVRGALQVRLLTTSSLPAVSYEGRKYTPVVGTPFVEPVLVPGSGDPFSINGETIDHRGSFEISVVYPIGLGVGTCEAMADAIRARFAPSTSLFQNTIKVKIVSNARRKALIETDWVRVPVSIVYRCFAAT